MAIAHRLSAIHAAMSIGAVLWSLVGRRLPRLSPLGFALLTLPIVLDGVSHMVSEVTLLDFRESNLWAMWLTGGRLPPTFYLGTTVGTLNWLLRTLTGALFGLASVWFTFPYLATGFGEIAVQAEHKLRSAGVIREG